MISLEQLYDTVDRYRKAGAIKKENFWVYISMTENKANASQKEHKQKGYIGFFCEDDSRLPGILTVAERKRIRIN